MTFQLTCIKIEYRFKLSTFASLYAKMTIVTFEKDYI